MTLEALLYSALLAVQVMVLPVREGSIAIYVVCALSFVAMRATVDVYVSSAVNAERAEPGASVTCSLPRA